MSISKKILRVKIGVKKVVLIFDNGDKFEILPNTYTEYNFFPGKALSKKDIDVIKFNDEIGKYLEYSTKLLASKAYSKHQLKEKLIKKGAKEAQIEAIIDRLVKYQLLDDKEVIKDFLDYANYKHFGYNKIKDELSKKGISSIYIEKIKYDEDREIKHASILLEGYIKKYSRYNYYQTKRHIYEALLRQGYTYDVATKVCEKLPPLDEKKEFELLKVDYQKAKKKYEGKYGPYETIDKISEYLMQKGYRYKDIAKLKEKK